MSDVGYHTRRSARLDEVGKHILVGVTHDRWNALYIDT